MADTPRDLLKPLLIVDGPDKGERRAYAKDSFVTVVVWDTRRVADQPPPTTYRLRRHASLGLVWASEPHADLTDTV